MDTTALDAVIAFLLGDGSLDGRWFGDRPPAGRGPYWWRRHLREAAARLRAVAGEPVAWAQLEEGEVVGLAFKCIATGDCATPLYLHPATVTDEDVERACKAAGDYWDDDTLWVSCKRCIGRGFHHGFGEDGNSPDWCDDCGGTGNYHSGTEGGAMRAALESFANKEPTDE